jgi:hypothetical protein
MAENKKGEYYVVPASGLLAFLGVFLAGTSCFVLGTNSSTFLVISGLTFIGLVVFFVSLGHRMKTPREKRPKMTFPKKLVFWVIVILVVVYQIIKGVFVGILGI